MCGSRQGVGGFCGIVIAGQRKAGLWQNGILGGGYEERKWFSYGKGGLGGVGVQLRAGGTGGKNEIMATSGKRSWRKLVTSERYWVGK